MENSVMWHYKNPTDEELVNALNELNFYKSEDA